jgi:hypothetical protein
MSLALAELIRLLAEFTVEEIEESERKQTASRTDESTVARSPLDEKGEYAG